MTTHSKRGPSQAKKFRACAGCFAMAGSVPKELRKGHGDAARLGTATHALIEHCLKKGKTPEDLRDRIIMVIEREDEEGASILREGAKMPKQEADHFAFIVDDDMIDDADVAVNYVRERCAELGVKETVLELETRTNPLPGRDDTSGTADITIPAWPEMLEVADYKNGYLLVEHEDNDQARAYLLGKAIETDFAYESYKATIIQPNCQHAEGAIRSVEYTADELKAFGIEYEESIERCEEAEKEFERAIGKRGDVIKLTEWEKTYLKPGDHCVFCEAGAACPSRQRYAEELARIEFADAPGEIQLPAVAKSGEVLGPTEEQVARILAWGPFLDALIRAAELYAHRALEAGYEIPGFKLVARRSIRKLIEEPAPTIVKRLVTEGFIGNADVEKLYTARKLKSGPQIEKLIPKKKRKDFADTFLTKPDNGTTVAPIDDPRASVEPAIETDFEDVTEELDFG